MPKLVDSYVMTRVIGAGQYGQVLKGYDRTTNNDVAVKVIRRDKIKGKFSELLESEIKVLKSCDNPNIIKLYDIKKTPNNFYLVIEYCNQGDLDQYVKKKKFLTEDEAIEILCQILNGFRTLVKYKIMHRDFKLPNVLLHDGEIKIADFGFAKLLGDDQSTKTVLGSPLNMAPEIIRGQVYNQKVDIYSIGICFYQMLYGKPPFNAVNVQQLVKVIDKGEIPFPKHVNRISKLSEDLIRKMLAAKPDKRIDWPQLFKHPALGQNEQQAVQHLQTTMGAKGNLMSNMSKFYIKNNLVIIHPSQILKKQEVNQYAFSVIKSNKPTMQFKGEVNKRNDKRRIEVNTKTRAKIAEQDQTLQQKETKEELMDNAMRRNTSLLLNERNMCVFILTILEELQEMDSVKKTKQLQFVIASALLARLQEFWTNLKKGNNQFKLEFWESYVECPAWKLLRQFFQKEEEIFRFQLDEYISGGIKSSLTEKELVKSVTKQCIQMLKESQKDPSDQTCRIHWIRVDHLFDYLNLEAIMRGKDQSFNFKLYYLNNGKIDLPDLINKVLKKSKEI